MRFRSIWNAVQGYNREQESRFQDDWDRARFIAAWATSRKIKKEQDLRPFPWDKKEQKKGDGFDSVLRQLEKKDLLIDKLVKQQHNG